MKSNHDVATWRADTPGCATRVHLNNAGASLMPAVVKDAITEHLGRESLEGGYEAEAAVSEQAAAAYAALGTLVGGNARNIAIVSSATDGFGRALSSIDFRAGDVIATTNDDYVSNQLMFLSLAKRAGVRVVRAPDSAEGGVDVAALERIVKRERPRVVALSWVPTSGGVVQPAAEVGKVCEAAEVPFVLDACQSVGQMPIDIKELRCDFLAATARKFLRGPRGIGFLAVSDRALARGDFPLQVDMRGAHWTDPDAFTLVDDARRFQQWELPWALVFGMAAAARYALEVGLEVASRRANALAALARERLSAIPGVRSLERSARRSAIATFAVEGRAGRDVMLALRAQGINTSAQAREDALIPLDRSGTATLWRVSPHYYNTEHEIEQLTVATEQLLRG